MPSASALTLTVGALPIIFTPVKVSPSRSVLLNRTSTISAGFKELVVGLNSHDNNRPTDKISLRINEPYEFTNSDGEQQVDHVMRFSGEWTVHKDIPASVREDFEELVRVGLQEVIIKGYIRDLDPMY